MRSCCSQSKILPGVLGGLRITSACHSMFRHPVETVSPPSHLNSSRRTKRFPIRSMVSDYRCLQRTATYLLVRQTPFPTLFVEFRPPATKSSICTMDPRCKFAGFWSRENYRQPDSSAPSISHLYVARAGCRASSPSPSWRVSCRGFSFHDPQRSRL